MHRLFRFCIPWWNGRFHQGQTIRFYYLLGNRVVCIENIGCSRGYTELDFFENDFRTAVTDNLVTKKVSKKNVIRGNFFYEEAEPAFINFQNGEIRFCFSAKGAVGKKGSCDSAEHVGTEAVVDNGVSVFAEHMGYKVRGGCFSVCTGDADNLALEFKAVKNLRANYSCNIAGF